MSVGGVRKVFEVMVEKVLVKMAGRARVLGFGGDLSIVVE